MSVADLYLICFLIGFLLSAVSFLLGSFHVHLPHFHLGHIHVHAPNAAHGAHGVAANELPAINFGTITAFLAWFGGIGYLLTTYSSLVARIALLLAISGGMIGASVVFFLVSRLLMKHDRPLNPADYEMVGVLGRIVVPIREKGTGELIYSQEGSRRTCGARTEDGSAVAKGTEVVVTHYERGIAYVRPWDEIARNGPGSHDAQAAEREKQ